MTQQTESNRNNINNTINEFKLQKPLNDTTAKNIQTLEARTPNFYMQQKIHKESHPGRPVISSVNCHTNKFHNRWSSFTATCSRIKILC